MRRQPTKALQNSEDLAPSTVSPDARNDSLLNGRFRSLTRNREGFTLSNKGSWSAVADGLSRAMATGVALARNRSTSPRPTPCGFQTLAPVAIVTQHGTPVNRRCHERRRRPPRIRPASNCCEGCRGALGLVVHPSTRQLRNPGVGKTADHRGKPFGRGLSSPGTLPPAARLPAPPPVRGRAGAQTVVGRRPCVTRSTTSPDVCRVPRRSVRILPRVSILALAQSRHDRHPTGPAGVSGYVTLSQPWRRR